MPTELSPRQQCGAPTSDQPGYAGRPCENKATRDGRCWHHGGSRPDSVEGSLSYRELQVLERLAHGDSNKELAAALGISEHTAKFHVRAVGLKLGVAGPTAGDQVRVKSVIRGLQLGLLQLEAIKLPEATS